MLFTVFWIKFNKIRIYLAKEAGILFPNKHPIGKWDNFVGNINYGCLNFRAVASDEKLLVF